MIARLGYFEGLTEEQKAAQEDNFRRRFRSAITSQPGLVALFAMENPNGDRVSVSIWESEEALKLGGARANATPLLPGQRREAIPQATRVEIWNVRELFLPREAAAQV